MFSEENLFAFQSFLEETFRMEAFFKFAKCYGLVCACTSS